MMKQLASVALAMLLPVSSWGQGIVDEYITNNDLHVEVELGAIAADVVVGFENVSGLATGALGLSVELVDITDLTLLARLPSSSLVSIPAAFPVKLSIAPPATGNLLMRGVAVVSFHTHNLEYVAGTPLRLFKAEHGGSFFDITDRTSSGSYRVRGSGGDFSEFMIVADLRPTTNVALIKLNRLEATLQANQAELTTGLYSTLSALLVSARAEFTNNDYEDAIILIDEFRTVMQKSGAEIPDVWRPRDDLVNVSGQLRATASTLNFSLSLLANNL